MEFAIIGLLLLLVMVLMWVLAAVKESAERHFDRGIRRLAIARQDGEAAFADMAELSFRRSARIHLRLGNRAAAREAMRMARKAQLY